MSKKKEKQTKASKTIGKTAIVSWEDHWSSSDGWSHVGDHSPMICRSAGIVVFEDNKVLQITTSMDPQGKVSNIMTILKKNITKRKNV